MSEFKIGDTIIANGYEHLGIATITAIDHYNAPKNRYYLQWANVSGVIAGENFKLASHDLKVDKLAGLVKDTHAGHEIVKNVVLNKEFSYCRNCKVEV